jgi:hypothetical protein
MTQTIDERRTVVRGGPDQRQRPGRQGVLRSLLDRICVFQLPEPAVRPSHGRPDEAYRVLEDARAMIARGWIQDHWFARRPAQSGRRAQESGTSNGLSDVAASCLVGAVVYAVQLRGSGDPLVKAGPALDYLWDAWQESRGLGGTGVAGRAAPRELRMVRVRDLTRWNDQPGRTREQVLGLVDLAASRAIMAAVRVRCSPTPHGNGRSGSSTPDVVHVLEPGGVQGA